MPTPTIQSPDALKREHDLVVKTIQNDLSILYVILSNVDKAEHQIGGLFPDLICINKETNRPQFVIEVKRNGNIARCLQQWNSIKDMPAFIFLIVPESDLPNARDVAQALGISIGIGSYSIDGDTITMNYDGK